GAVSAGAGAVLAMGRQASAADVRNQSGKPIYRGNPLHEAMVMYEVATPRPARPPPLPLAGEDGDRRKSPCGKESEHFPRRLSKQVSAPVASAVARRHARTWRRRVHWPSDRPPRPARDRCTARGRHGVARGEVAPAGTGRAVRV